MICEWCREVITNPATLVNGGTRRWHRACLIDERDELERHYREAVNALSPYLQAGGEYAFLMSPGESITRVGPARLVEHFKARQAALLAVVEAGEARVKASATVAAHHAACESCRDIAEFNAQFSEGLEFCDEAYQLAAIVSDAINAEDAALAALREAMGREP